MRDVKRNLIMLPRVGLQQGWHRVALSKWHSGHMGLRKPAIQGFGQLCGYGRGWLEILFLVCRGYYYITMQTWGQVFTVGFATRMAVPAVTPAHRVHGGMARDGKEHYSFFLRPFFLLPWTDVSYPPSKLYAVLYQFIWTEGK